MFLLIIAPFAFFAYLFYRYPGPMSVMSILGLILVGLTKCSVTEPTMRGLGYATPATILVRPIQIDWVSDDSYEGAHRALTAEVTNQTGNFYSVIYLECQSRHSTFRISDTSGIMANQQREVRSYQIPSNVNEVLSCHYDSGLKGKPTRYQSGNNEAPASWTDREPDVTLPIDTN